MGFFDAMHFSTLDLGLLILVLALSVALILSRRAVAPQPKAASQPIGFEGLMEWVKESESVCDSLSKNLQEKRKIAKRLIAQLDKKIEEMNQALSKLNEKESAPSDRRKNKNDQAAIIEMSQSGCDASQIARWLGIPQGQVELVLDVRKFGDGQDRGPQSTLLHSSSLRRETSSASSSSDRRKSGSSLPFYLRVESIPLSSSPVKGEDAPLSASPGKGGAPPLSSSPLKEEEASVSPSPAKAEGAQVSFSLRKGEGSPVSSSVKGEGTPFSPSSLKGGGTQRSPSPLRGEGKGEGSFKRQGPAKDNPRVQKSRADVRYSNSGFTVTETP